MRPTLLGRTDHDRKDRARDWRRRNIAENRKAFHDYHLLETFEAGIVLLGTEVKAIREGRVNLRDSFARVEDGEVFLYNVNISPYSHRGYADHEPLRRRKLLLHRDEIRKLIGKTVEKGMTLVPVRLYFKNGRVKVAVEPRQGQEGLRQARDDQAARSRSRDPRGHQVAPQVQSACETADPMTVPLLDLRRSTGRSATRSSPRSRASATASASSWGPRSTRSSASWRALLGVEHAIAVSSGTDALLARADGARDRAGRRGDHADLFVLRDGRLRSPRSARRRCSSTSTR